MLHVHWTKTKQSFIPYVQKRENHLLDQHMAYPHHTLSLWYLTGSNLATHCLFNASVMLISHNADVNSPFWAINVSVTSVDLFRRHAISSFNCTCQCTLDHCLFMTKCSVLWNLSITSDICMSSFSSKICRGRNERKTNRQTERETDRAQHVICNAYRHGAPQNNYLCIAAATSQKPCGDVLLRSQCTTDNVWFTCSSFDKALAPESPARLPLSTYYIQ